MEQLGANIAERSTGMADQMLATINSVGATVIENSTRALDDRSRESLERVTTDTARAVASFLYARDQDIRQAAHIEPGEAAYRAFLADRQRELFVHQAWKLASDGSRWEPAESEGIDPSLAADPEAALADNTRDFSARPPEYLGHREMRPLFAEMTFIGLDGRERVKVTTGVAGTPELADISDRRRTFAKAETYWRDLQQLKPDEIYVSEVIGTYVGSRIIGPYLPETARKAGIAFAPEQSAYAGTENPVGRRFRGIVRWAMPIERNGVRVGYVTLALDHDHIRQFTDRIVPTAKRYTPISDAIDGNYAFMWDYKSRAISHPRDYFIPGYNAETGLPETPWLDQSLYESWQVSGKSALEFLAETPSFLDQSLKKKPAVALVRAGTVGLDCRYLNFSPQCKGWDQLTENGGSGSFVIFFGGLWKLTTAATIPYYTGQYGRTPRGFGYVTIGANVDDFHRAATESKRQIDGVIEQKDVEFRKGRAALVDAIRHTLSLTTWHLLLSTTIMVLIVIIIAIMMAGVLTRRITAMIGGIRHFQEGDYGFRLAAKSADEMGDLAISFNRMADTVQESFAGMSRELHSRKQAEEQLRIAATAFDAQVGIVVTDSEGVILRINRAFTEITGYSAEDAVGQTPRLLKSGRHDATFYAAMWKHIRGSGVWQGEIWDRRKNGEIYPKWLTITAIKGDDGVPTHYVGTQIDITESKAAEEEIKTLAFYDPLTRLPNRRLLLERVRHALATSLRTQRHGALLFIDLDNFKMLNDTRGHDTGDLLLQQVAQRLSICVREGDTVARLGGDEFVVMLEDLSNETSEAATHVEMVGEKLLAALNQIFEINGLEHKNTASVGVTVFGREHETIEDLLKKADFAMYQAKAAGRNTLRFFDPKMQAEVAARVAFEADLRKAVLEKQFTLCYQAQAGGDGRITGAEALIRWNHPQRGFVPPGEFIPLAEETGLILPLGHWVLETACGQITAWANRIETRHLTLAVNVSARQFRQADFVEQVLAVLDRTGANPDNLKLELTESMLVDNVEDVISKMAALKSRGLSFSLDDFGTGYSSLSYLKRLPLDELKIDKSFVNDVLVNRGNGAIAQTIINLGETMGLSVIAEGVETQEQRDFLGHLGCPAFQGYLFSRPVPVDEFEGFLSIHIQA
jgi:diguanylate cyclase (GGDEF)-like protein/PAS domain S-box-containing protein